MGLGNKTIHFVVMVGKILRKLLKTHLALNSIKAEGKRQQSDVVIVRKSLQMTLQGCVTLPSK